MSSTHAVRILLIATLLALNGLAVAIAAGRGEPGAVRAVRVEHVDRPTELKLLQQLDVDIDAVTDDWSRIYVVDDELRKLEQLGLRLTILTPEQVLGPREPSETTPSEPRAGVPAEYHTYETLTSELQAIAAAYPEITRLVSIGQSVQGRELWMMLISDNAGQSIEEDEVELTFISSMHGDEVVGKELCVNLIVHLVESYGSDSRLTQLVDEAEIWIMPSMNPDGTALQQRYNAKGWDLNRNFPDQFVDPTNTTLGRQPETAAVMDWAASRSIDLTANFHGGELIVNYPLDANVDETPTFSPAPAPDHATYVSISRTYADLNVPMSNNNSHPAFDDGITNGADWYVIHGGLQDWAYVWHGALGVLVELSTVKWPPASELPLFWENNRESLISYLERGLEGVRGRVTDVETGQPVPATIRIDANPYESRTDPDVGDYHRLLLPGEYTLNLSATGYSTVTLPFVVGSGPAARYDVGLAPLPTDLSPTGRRIIDADGYADPGETVDLAVTLGNSGRSTSGVTATLLPTGWSAIVDRQTATYPDIPTGGSGESNAPHFGITIIPDAPAGGKAGFAIHWASEQGSAVSSPFFVEVGTPSCQTVSSSEVPRSVIDLATVTSSLDISSDIEIDEVQVMLDLSHTYIGDLRLSLISPEGTRVVLHDRSGGAADDIAGTYGVDLNPAESLSVLEMEFALGTWTLEIRDELSGDTGVLNAWSLVSCGLPVESTPPEMRFRDLTRDGDSVQLDWWPYPALESYRVYRSSDPGAPTAFADLTSLDTDDTDTRFVDAAAPSIAFYLVTGVGPRGEGP